MDNRSFESSLFKSADKLRKNIDAAEYKNVVLGLIFLKYISDSFTELYQKLEQDQYSDPEDRDEYLAENIFFVPKSARWELLQANAKLPEIGTFIDNAMSAIEKENKDLKNVLPKVFGKPNLDKTSLGQLIDLISDVELKAQRENTKDLLGRIYEYFLGEFANAEGSFLKDAHPDLKADYILANPPFNQKERGEEILQDDGRWKYGLPPKGNANFAWIQHMLFHLAYGGVMATVLANGSLSSKTSGEGDIRERLVREDLVDSIIALPKQLFYNTGIPATIWILRKGKKNRSGNVLFIDASNMGYMKDRVHRDFSEDNIKK